MGLLTEYDEAAFIALCLTWSEWRTLAAIIDRERPVVAGKRGAQRVHPLMRTRESAAKRYFSLATSFGMTPRSRQRLSTL